MTRQDIIEKNKHLFWYINKEKLPELSNDVLVEFIFNYGQWEDIKDLIKILGFKELKKVFNNIKGRQKGNYIPEMYDLLERIVTKYAS